MAQRDDMFEPGKRQTIHSSKEGGKYSGTYNSYSGADIVAYIYIPTDITKQTAQVTDVQSIMTPEDIKHQTLGKSLVDVYGGDEPVMGILGTLQTISYSIFREVEPVRSLGKTYAHSYTRGPRTIAGTMVWATLDQHVLAKALRNAAISEQDPSSILVDQLPPFSIIITFNNEYGDVSTMGIYGIRMVNEGSTFSIDDIMTEQTNTYVATDIDMMHKGDPFRDSRATMDSKKASYILTQEARKRLKDHKNVFR